MRYNPAMLAALALVSCAAAENVSILGVTTQQSDPVGVAYANTTCTTKKAPVLPAAYFTAAAVFVVWASSAQFKLGAVDIGSAKRFARDLVIGFAIWWPANVIGDGMPLFVADGANAAYATLAMTAGNIAVLYCWPQTKLMVRWASAFGCVSIVIAFVGGVIAAAFVAGFAGAAATSVVWGVTDDPKAIGIGMTLSAVISSAAVLACPSTMAYLVVAAVVGVASVAATTIPEKPSVPHADEETLVPDTEIDVPEDAPKEPEVPPAPRPDRAVYFFYYALAYALPGVLPIIGMSTLEYKGAIALGTVGDIVGRTFSEHGGRAHLTLAAIAFAAAVTTNNYIPRALLIAGFYIVRGDAVTAIATRASKTSRIGAIGQIGATVGAIATAIATNV